MTNDTAFDRVQASKAGFSAGLLLCRGKIRDEPTDPMGRKFEQDIEICTTMRLSRERTRCEI